MKKILISFFSVVLALYIGISSALVVSFKNNANFRNEIDNYIEKEDSKESLKTEISELELKLEEKQKNILNLNEQILMKENLLLNINAELETARSENSENLELIESLESEKASLESDIEILTS